MKVQEILERFSGQRVLIIGDVMLDEYVWGEVRRISPEAPVPVVEAQSRSYAPGGAGNVAANIASLGGRALLGGLVGADEAAGQLQRVLAECGVTADGLLPDPQRPTTTKTRIVAHSQQLVRVDSERRAPLPEALEPALLRWAEARLPQAGACVLSDYHKGVATARFTPQLIRLARQYGKPIVVDPKGTDYERYRGATVITPNIHEAEQAAGLTIADEEALNRAATALLALLDGGQVLVTRGAQGMSLYGPDAPPAHIPTVARHVYDVTGAGDTVVSALALALAAGADMETAARLANRAAGIVVGKLGTARVTLEELRRELAAD